MAKGILLAVLLLGKLASLPAQDTIWLDNPSFEGVPQQGQTPSAWMDCGSSDDSPPDLQPGHFGVMKPPKSGRSYLGMVVRDNDTWEAVAQFLDEPLEPGETYSFGLFLARSEMYLSLSQRSKEPANYTEPVRLRIWGGNDYCDRAELLDESQLITNIRWIRYDFQLKPTQRIDFLLLEAFYKADGQRYPYNGHLLLDDCSPIVKVMH